MLRVKGAVLDTFGPQYINGNGPFVIRASLYATFDIFLGVWEQNKDTL